MDYSIEAENLSKTYKDFSLDHISFTVPTGSIMGLIGENGAGKTTTIRLLLGAVKPDSGVAKVLGKDLSRTGERMTLNDVGVVFEETALPAALNPRQLSKIMGGIYHSWDDTLFHAYLKEFTINEKTKIGESSRGTRMKISIAVALSHHPRLLLLDEPTNALDPLARAMILDLFQQFMEDATHAILFSSHITTDLEKIADYVTCLHKGRMVFSEPKDNLLYTYGLFRGTREQFARVKSSDFISIKEGKYGLEALTSDRQQVSKSYPYLVPQRLGIEEIMVHLLTGKGENKQ